MFALREATQKVIAAKKDTDMIPQLGSLVSGGNADHVIWTKDSINQITMDNQQCSNEAREVASSSGPMLIQQPLNLVVITPGLPNESGQAPSATNFPNGQAVQGGLENQRLNMMIPVSVQKQLSPTAQRLDGNGLPGTSMSAGRKRKHSTTVDGMDSFITIRDVGERDSKQDEAANQPQD
ncbi:hypothetical protein COCNU_scaffold023281G000010 [Cocos nucifera]|nr:hypothetical protein [Cocos nucifera]